MKVNQDLSILFWLWKQKKDANGKAPIYARLTIDGTRTQFSLGHKVLPTLFNKESGLVKGSSEEAKAINNYLILVKGKLQQHYNILITQNEVVTPEMVRNAFSSKADAHKTLVQAFTYHNEQFEQKVKGGLRVGATLKKFKTTFMHIKNFLKKEYGVNDMPLANIKHSFAEDFEHYLTITVKLQNNTAMKQIRNTKKILFLAVQKDWLSKNPIAGFRCSYHNPERARLMQDELNTLISKQFNSKRLEEVRDCYVAMCFTGYAYRDAASLAPENIQLMIDGQKWFIKNRIKTECKENVPIMPMVEELIEKYKHHPYCVKYNKVFPIHSNQKFNDYLKEVAAVCGINKVLTTHTARHTFATTVTLSNGVPIETVSALLGHRSIRTTQIYAKVVAQKVSNDMNDLKLKLLKHSADLKMAK
jgi:site-specific recombinase XerD